MKKGLEKVIRDLPMATPEQAIVLFNMIFAHYGLPNKIDVADSGEVVYVWFYGLTDPDFQQEFTEFTDREPDTAEKLMIRFRDKKMDQLIFKTENLIPIELNAKVTV